ncbi:DNA-binding protein [Escherichia coli]
MRPAIFEPQQIVEAGLALQAEGRNITGFALRNRVGGGNPGRLKQVWDEYISSQTEVTTGPVAELPVEVAEEVKAVSSALAERISQLATELNDKAVRAAERRVAEVTRAAGEQTTQAERELADAAQTVDDLEETLDTLREEHSATLAALDDSRRKEQAQAVELAQLRERLAATERLLGESEKAGKEAAEQHRQQQADLQKRLDAAEKKLAEAITNHAIEIKGIKEQHTGEIKELKAQHARSEKELQNRLDTELKARQAALDKALRDATDAREAKATLTGELQSLKTHNDQLAALLAGKK